MKPLPAFRKFGAGLVPNNEAGREQFAKVKEGQVCVCDIRRPRNPAHHRKFFALMGILVDNTEQFATTRHALHMTKLAMGFGEEMPDGRGGTSFVPKSIAFESMSQDEFEPFYTDAIATIIKHWLTGSTPDEIRAAVEAFQD